MLEVIKRTIYEGAGGGGGRGGGDMLGEESEMLEVIKANVFLMCSLCVANTGYQRDALWDSLGVRKLMCS
jgi:hypothetical protein